MTSAALSPTPRTEQPDPACALGFDPAYFCIEWNAEGELTRVLKDSVEVASFKCDPLGRRVEKVAGGVTTRWVYDGADILRETDGAATSIYVQGPGIDEPLRAETSVGYAYYHADALGSIVATTDVAGTVTSSRRYDAWGRIEVGAAQEGYGFTGREWDPETGLYYYRARYYDPHSGRFISEDPIGFAAGVNFYRYASANPTGFIDPFGLTELVFDGRGVTIRDDNGNFQGYVPATSGRPGSTDPRAPWEGPIPEGDYSLDPAEISEGNWLRDLFGDWGDYRVPLKPVEGTETFDRSGFFLHGGTEPGSAGCIDVGRRDRHIFDYLLREGGLVDVRVRYPSSGPPPVQ